MSSINSLVYGVAKKIDATIGWGMKFIWWFNQLVEFWKLSKTLRQELGNMYGVNFSVT